MKKLFLLLIMILIPIHAKAIEEPEILPSETGIVESVKYENVNNETIQGKQIVNIKLLSGEFSGEKIETENILTGNPYYDIKLKKNTRVILHAEEDSSGGITYSIEDVKRSDSLLWLSLIFCGLLIYVGKRKGFYSLFSIGLTVLLITHCLSPLILIGLSPVLSAILICIVSTVITMYLVGGFNAKSSAASAGTILSLIFAGLLSYITICTASLTGFSSETSMFLYNTHPQLDFVGITIATMVLATLGAVMDVAMSISSTINEIYVTDNTKSVKELFISGMNVGRDIIGTMANTLILVYLGGSLPLILLAGNIDLQKFINLNQVVTEVASALIGSIAIVICVPFTAAVASGMIHHHGKREKIINEVESLKKDSNIFEHEQH